MLIWLHLYLNLKKLYFNPVRENYLCIFTTLDKFKKIFLRLDLSCLYETSLNTYFTI